MRKQSPAANPPGPARRQLTPADFTALAEFRYALRRFAAFSEAAAVESGLTPQQHQAMLAIKGASGASMAVGEIADRLIIRHHSAVELVNRLERMGLAQRSAHPTDKRRVQVSLTELAEERLEQLTSAHLEELRAIGPLLRRLLEHFH
jgi:DNA-binding MarR family transcriptional regulator